MFVAPTSPRHNVQDIIPPAGVTPVHAEPAPATPIEILLYTSRNDFSYAG